MYFVKDQKVPWACFKAFPNLLKPNQYYVDQEGIKYVDKEAVCQTLYIIHLGLQGCCVFFDNELQ